MTLAVDKGGPVHPDRAGQVLRTACVVVGVLLATDLLAGPSGGTPTASGATIGGPRPTQARSSGSLESGPPAALRVVSVTEGGAVTRTDGAEPLDVTLSAPLAVESPMPSVQPAVAGTWARSGKHLTFTPVTPFTPASTITVRFPAGPSGLRSVTGGLLAATSTDRVHTRGWSRVRLEQLLAELGYLPLTWTPQLAGTGGVGPSSDLAAQLAAVYDPPTGVFSWQPGYPSTLTRLWAPDQDNLVVQGAVRAFQAQNGLTMDGMAGPHVWSDLLQAAVRGTRNPSGYTYALASKSRPESLTVWHNGTVVLHSLANTGIPVAPTTDGTFPVYLRYQFQVMRGTNPDGSHYADPVSWVAYFNAGEAVHYFPRSSFGYPQSLGCVELPYQAAHDAWPYLTYGSLVTITG